MREAPALLPELRAIVDSCATGDQGAPLDKQLHYGPGPGSATSRWPPSASGLAPLRPRYPGTSFILRYEARRPAAVVPAARCGESHDYAFPIPGWAGSESLYMGVVRVVRVPGGPGQCPDRRIVAGGAGGSSIGPRERQVMIVVEGRDR